MSPRDLHTRGFPGPGTPECADLARTVGWGIAGCGWVARDHALPALLAVDGARVVALHDLDPGALDRMPVEGAARTTDLAEFLATPGLDAVYVAVPNAGHRPLVEAAASTSGRCPALGTAT